MQYTQPQISRLAVDLMTDKYQLSKIFTREEQHTSVDEQYRVTAKAKRDAQNWKNIGVGFESVPRVIYEYKNSIVVDLIKTEMLKLKRGRRSSRYKATESIMKTIANYNILKAQFAKN